MNEILIRLNGRGNAWPVFLGQHSPFYNSNNAFDISNASYSIICREKASREIKNEVLIDAGHGVVQFLVQNQNHLPNALILTHPHIDHCLSTDWIAQSYFKFKNQKLPVYASKMCWDRILKSFPQLDKTVDYQELKPGISKIINEFNKFEITFYPVFHGETAFGAGMILFKNPESNYKALFTGDLLCPLLRKKDIEVLKNCDVIYTDTNNRFAYPNSNHWSLVKNVEGKKSNPFFDEWFNKKGQFTTWLTGFNLPRQFDALIHQYFEELLKEQYLKQDLCFNIFEFSEKIQAKTVNLVHYSGSEDKKHHHQEILSEKQLEEWVIKKANAENLKTIFRVPKVGDEFFFI